MPLISARLLGPPELLLDGEAPPPPLRWRKHLGLCLLLWANDGRRVSRDSALAMLWGDREERDARHSLNEALRVIRKAVGADAIEASGEMIHWLAPVTMDTDRFAPLEHTDPVAAAALVRGTWCEGFAIPDAGDYERWLDDERRTWQHRLVAVLAAAASVEGDRGNPAAALRAAERACRLDPLSETAVRAKILAHALDGDRSAAIAEGTEFARRLDAELGITLSNDTMQLLRRLAERRAAAPVAGGAGKRHSLPFVGCGSALEQLLVGVRDARARGIPGLLLIDGPPGSGRTRLLEEVQLRAGLDGMTVLTVRSVPADQSTQGAGLRAIAGSGLAASPGVSSVGPGVLDALIDASPAWAERFASRGGGEGVTTHDALVAALRATCAERAVCLGLDDLNWLDDFTLRQLPDLMRGVGGLPFVLVATAQVGETRSELDTLRKYVDRADRGVQVRLEPMTHVEVHQLVEAALPAWSGEAHDRLTRRLLVESAGVAAVVSGVLEAVVRGLALEDAVGPWPTPDRTLDATLPARLPDALTAGTRLRFHLLDEPLRELLTLLAVQGSPLPAPELARLTEQSQAEVDRRLDALEWEHWLVVDARGYRFRARAIGTLVATEMLTPGQRQRLQQRMASS